MGLIDALAIVWIASVTLVHANIFERDPRPTTSHASRNGDIKTSVRHSNTANSNQPPILLDIMRQRYFAIEDAIWRAIDDDLEQSYALQQIHSGHKTFLGEDFADKNCYYSSFDPEQRTVYDAIQRINQSVETTVDNYLHSSRQFYRETDALAVSARNRNLTYHFDRLVEIAGTSDFYMTIRNVSDSHFYLFVYFIVLIGVVVSAAKFAQYSIYMKIWTCTMLLLSCVAIIYYRISDALTRNENRNTHWKKEE